MEEFTHLIEEINHKRGLLFQPAPCRSGKYVAEFIGPINGIGTLILAFTKHFPVELPDLYVKDISKPYLHVETDGKICLLEQSSLLINTNDPEQLVLDCIDLAWEISQLEPRTPEYEQELHNEFLSYWGFRDYGYIMYSILQIPIDDVICREYAVFRYEKTYLVADSIEEAQAYLTNTLHYTETIQPLNRKALVIKLKKDGRLPSPFVRYDWSKTLKYIVDNTDSETRRQFLNYMNTPVTKIKQMILLVFPKDENDILFGFDVTFQNHHKMPMKASRTKIVLQINLIRRDYDFLLSRCSAVPSLKNKRILLLGCGSIGGFIANNLCQMGITQLDMIDDDEYTVENVYRHFLGFDGVRGKASHNKADILKHHLEDKYAYLDLDALNYQERAVQDIILTNPARLSSYDLIISALGEPTINLEINRILVENAIAVPFIICFNEPYGIGGHVISTNLSYESCLQCYYTDLSSGNLVPFLGSFVQPGQNFKRSLSGCSGIFVPYSTLDSQQTAIHTARKAIDILNGITTCNNWFNWRGDSSVMEAQGFCLSPVFHSPPKIERFKNPLCPVCRGRDNRI